METAAATTTPTTSADEASRAQMKAPETLSTAPSTEAANNASFALPEAANDAGRVVITPPESRDNSAALLPPETPPVVTSLPNPTAPKPDTAAVPQMPAGHGDKAKKIEQNIANFLGDPNHLAAEYSKGLFVDVVLANSNAVTGEAGYQNEHDLAIKIHGGAYNVARDQAIQAALKSHPAFAGVNMHVLQVAPTTPQGAGEYAITAKTYGLDATRIAELLKPILAQGTTMPIAKDVVPAVNAAVLADSPTTITEPEIKAPKIEDPLDPPKKDAVADAAPVQTAATEVQTAAQPVTQIVNPAEHQGRAVAANQVQAQGVA